MAIAIVFEVISDHATAVGPCDNDRSFQSCGLNDGVNLVGPRFVVLVILGIERLVRAAVPPQIVRDDVESFGQFTAGLLDPLKVALGKAMNEKNLWPAWISPYLGANGKSGRAF